MKNERVLESYISFFTTCYHLRPVSLFSEATLLVRKGVLNFVITNAIDSQLCLSFLES